MSKSTLTDLKERRSVRAYKPEQIKDEELNAILEAATFAPSASGAQPSVIVVIQNKALIARLEKINAEFWGQPDKQPFYGAPTLLAVLADKKSRPLTYVEDGSLVLGSLLNAAHALGIGSCWIHRARQTFEGDTGKALLKEWGLSDDYAGIGFCILGYPEGALPAAKPRKENYIKFVR